MEKKRFKQIIYKAIRRNEAFSILDEVADGCDWSSGGCAILALALNKLFGFSIHVIYNKTYNSPEHFVVNDGETFIDDTGVYKDTKELIRLFTKHERPREGELVVLPYTSDLPVGDIIIDDSVATKLADFLRKRL